MKRMSAVALLAISSLFAAKGMPAQQHDLKVNIPFAFTVGDTWMPAGEYKVSSPNHSEIRLKNVATGAVGEIVSLPSNHASDSGSELVFDRYGDRYFLHRVLCPGDLALNVDIAQGKAEKRARTTEAGLPYRGETLVAAR
jgi:hypothetical protein